jgi:membrane-bound lytic murein transglycosylase MltF
MEMRVSGSPWYTSRGKRKCFLVQPFHLLVAGLMLAILILPSILRVSGAYAMKSAAEDDPSTVQVKENDELRLNPGNTWTGDLRELRKRGVIRVLVEYSRTDFFVVKGELFGFEYELMKEYERFLNKNRRGVARTRVVFIPTPFSEIIPALIAGKGDIAAADITITPAREEQVRFSVPYVKNVSEVLVTSRAVDAPRSIEYLSGKEVHVLGNSSHAEHLGEINRRLLASGKKEVKVIEAPAQFTAEDLLEMANAGIYANVVVDSHTARIWAKVLPNIAVHEEISVASDGRIAWAVRKESRDLVESVNAFFGSVNNAMQATVHKIMPQYYGNTKYVIQANGTEYTDRLRRYAAYFQEYCRDYHFQWLMAAALAFQESRFNELLVGRTGAVGLMQVLPTTGSQLGFHDLRSPMKNIHAGILYLDFLRKKYFSDPTIPENQKIYFILAAYNAGPNRVNRLRTLASKAGLDPNSWFRNVEYMAMNAIGRETPNYVSNIEMYFTAYKEAYDIVDKRDELRHEALEHGTSK